MGLRALEAEILRELRKVAGKTKIRQKDIVEWRTGRDLAVQEGETYYYLPVLGVSVAVKLPPTKLTERQRLAAATVKENMDDGS